MDNSTSALLSFPPELLHLVLSNITDTQTLYNVNLTCKRLHYFAEEHLYRNILIRRGSRAKNFTDALDISSSRITSVRDLSIRHTLDVQDGIETLSSKIANMDRLRHLEIETPCCNDLPWQQSEEAHWTGCGRIDFENIFAQASFLIAPELRKLRSLTSVTYHSHGDGASKYTLPDCSIFLHPTLKHLKISCMDISTFPSQDLSIPSRITELESLTFEECNIDADALGELLRYPKALKSLTLGERHYFQDSPIGILANEPDKLIRALSVQADSLEYLEHTGGKPQHPVWRDLEHPWGKPQLPVPMVPDTEGFRNAVPNLKTLCFGPSSFLHCFIQSGGHPRSLRLLKLSGLREQQLEHYTDDLSAYHDNWLPPPPEPTSYTPYEPQYTLQLVMDPDKEASCSSSLVERLWSNDLLRRSTYTFGACMRIRSCRLQIFGIKDVGFIPPYMYGEEQPQETLAYDSLAPVRFGTEIDARIIEQLRHASPAQ